jgi:hypothetical protein
MIFYTILALGLPSLFFYVYLWLKRNRSLFLELPALKRSFVFGNMLEMEKYVKNDRHPGVYCEFYDSLIYCFCYANEHRYLGIASSD